MTVLLPSNLCHVASLMPCLPGRCPSLKGSQRKPTWWSGLTRKRHCPCTPKVWLAWQAWKAPCDAWKAASVSGTRLVLKANLSRKQNQSDSSHSAVRHMLLPCLQIRSWYAHNLGKLKHLERLTQAPCSVLLRHAKVGSL